MTKVIARFYSDCGRIGSLEGLFTATKEDIVKITGKEIYFGEVLGKHSEVIHEIAGIGDDIHILSEDQDFIEKFEQIMGAGTVSGYSPFDYIDEDEEDDENE